MRVNTEAEEMEDPFHLRIQSTDLPGGPIHACYVTEGEWGSERPAIAHTACGMTEKLGQDFKYDTVSYRSRVECENCRKRLKTILTPREAERRSMRE